MNMKSMAFAVLTPLILMTGCAASQPGSPPVGQFDFQYQVEGDTSTRPYQVFDDGRHTYFQFHDRPEKLEVNVVAPSGVVTQKTVSSINYVRVESVAKSWRLTRNDHVYTITYTGPARVDQIRSTSVEPGDTGPSATEANVSIGNATPVGDITTRSIAAGAAATDAVGNPPADRGAASTQKGDVVATPVTATPAQDAKPGTAPAAPALPVWTLTAGRTVGQELQSWGDKAGWKVLWNMPKDWAVPTTSAFSGDFHTVAANVIETLAANGALIHAQFFDGNKTMVVTGPGVVDQ